MVGCLRGAESFTGAAFPSGAKHFAASSLLPHPQGALFISEWALESKRWHGKTQPFGGSLVFLMLLKQTENATCCVPLSALVKNCQKQLFTYSLCLLGSPATIADHYIKCADPPYTQREQKWSVDFVILIPNISLSFTDAQYKLRNRIPSHEFLNP